MGEQHNRIDIYTDGACSCNPGPAGIGIVLLYKDHKKKVSKFIGESTNNIAELEAIKLALKMIKPSHRETPIVIYTDSNYCVGLFTKDWSPKKNVELIFDIKELLKKFKYVGFKWVKAHNGNSYNELADYLATKAIKENR